MAIRESSEAQRQAVRKHDAEKVDKVTVRLPKGTKDQILSTGQPVNAFVIEAVAKMLKQISQNPDTLQDSQNVVK